MTEQWWTEEAVEALSMWLWREFGEDEPHTQWRSNAASILAELAPHVEARVCAAEDSLLAACRKDKRAVRAKAFEEAKRIVDGLLRFNVTRRTEYAAGREDGIHAALASLDEASILPPATPEAT